MKAIPTRSHRNAVHSTPGPGAPADPVDRALALLADGGFEFEAVDRCPAPCGFCDSAFIQAA